MMRAVIACALALSCVAFAADEPRVTAFSGASPGAAMPPGWKPLGLPHAKMPQFSLVDDAGVTVLRVQGNGAAGTMSHALSADPRTYSTLKWRWKIDHVVSGGDMMTKTHEDFAARVYVFFDVPRETLPLTVRAAMGLAALVYGAELPTATICYVWDNKYPVGTHAPSPFTDTVHTWVVRMGNGEANQWVTESRNVEVDFRAAFGSFWKGPVPRITGIAVGMDTDQTKENVTAWFGDFELGAKP